jgi:23S rRNA pseudouridine2457 synthase
MEQKYYIIYKPYKMLSQFTKEVPEHITLADLDYNFEKDVYPVGRLDKDSEGLLILTNDKQLNDRLLNPQNKHQKTYWVQVEGIPTEEALDQLRNGVEIKLPSKKKYKTQKAKVKLLTSAPQLPEREPAIRYRANIPTSWVAITLIEGKNRQVRKMTAKVGLPTLRLVRASIEQLELGEMQIGEVLEMDGDSLKAVLGL